MRTGKSDWTPTPAADSRWQRAAQNCPPAASATASASRSSTAGSQTAVCKPERSQGGKQQRLLTANGDIVDISSLQPTPDGRFVTTLQTPDQCPPHASTTAISPQETSLGEWVQGAGDRLDRQDRRSRDSVSSFSSCIGDGEDDAAGWSGWTQGSVDGEVTSRHPDENSLAFLQTLRRHNLKVALCLLSHTSVNLTSSARPRLLIPPAWMITRSPMV